MPTDQNSREEIRRLASARDEALQRYTRHLAAIQLRKSRWCALLSHGRAALRGRHASAAGLNLNILPHAH